MKVFQVQDATGAIAASSCPLKLNERISVRLPWTLAESLRRQAASSGMPPSEFARNLIQLGLAQRVGGAFKVEACQHGCAGSICLSQERAR
jgi:hypothetical protein